MFVHKVSNQASSVVADQKTKFEVEIVFLTMKTCDMCSHLGLPTLQFFSPVFIS